MTVCRRETLGLLAAVLPISRSCTLAGVPRGSYYHGLAGPAEREAMPRPAPPNKLTEAEREELIGVLNSTRFVDKAPRQVWAALLDSGTYLASVSTMYRLLRERDQVRERRAQARHESRKKPHLVARAPHEIFSWDITKLHGPADRQYYDLYVMIDIFSRYVVHWEVHPRESGELAATFMENAIRANGGIAPEVIHSDNGTSMTSRAVTDLLSTLDIVKSHSRPKVSNDNPYSEAAFKTLKYCPVFPDRFASLADARAFCQRFFCYYNHEHYHAGVGLHTPFTVHMGTAHAIQDKRAETIERFRSANPHRFTRTPRLPKIPQVAYINQLEEAA
ncbi:IS3 family transposase [Nonomuraea sp. NPDC002799]